MQKALEFAAFRIKEYKEGIIDAFESETSFNEKDFICKYLHIIMRDGP